MIQGKKKIFKQKTNVIVLLKKLGKNYINFKKCIKLRHFIGRLLQRQIDNSDKIEDILNKELKKCIY